MFIIQCPWCGERDMSEFSCGGESHIKRPDGSKELTDEEWAQFVFMRQNPKGLYSERWNHAAGCRQWFNVMRNTATDELLAVYKMGETPPDISTQEPLTPSGEAPIGSGNDSVKIMKPGEGA